MNVLCTCGSLVSPEGSIQVDPTTINGNDSGNATFNCLAMGGPGNEFSWTKVRENTLVVNDSELTLVGLMASDGGQYLCSVENLAGNDSTTVTLNSRSRVAVWIVPELQFNFSHVFTVSPVVIEHPQDQNVTSFEGTVMLVCIVTGFPAPTITWFQNGTLVEDSTLFTSVEDNVYTTRSTFMKSMAETNDSGMYFCRASIDGYDDVDSNMATVLVQGEQSWHNITQLYDEL